MFSHIVIFWMDPAYPEAAQEVLRSAEEYLSSIPGVLSFHAGRPVPSPRAVVDSTYQVALNLHFASHLEQEAYQVHPRHLEFLERCSKYWQRVLVYDFA